MPLLVIATRPLNLTICRRVQGNNGGQGRYERGAAMSTRRGDAHARGGCRLQPPTRVALQPQAAVTCDVYSTRSPSSSPGPALLKTLPQSCSGHEPLKARFHSSSSVCS